MAEKPRLSRQAMCDRLAMEFQDGWIVNLGVGMPTLCSNYVDPTKSLVFHSENGVIGYGPLAKPEEVDRHLVNAGGQNVTAVPGMAIVHHADSFALIRKGMLDVTVMGAYEVAENGDFANWRIPPRKGGGIGGAMDLAACAQRVFIALEHTTREGKSRLLKRCTLPITARGAVTLIPRTKSSRDSAFTSRVRRCGTRGSTAMSALSYRYTGMRRRWCITTERRSSMPWVWSACSCVRNTASM